MVSECDEDTIASVVKAQGAGFLWHRNLQHISEKVLKILLAEGMLPKLKSVNLELCEDFILRKQKSVSFPRLLIFSIISYRCISSVCYHWRSLRTRSLMQNNNLDLPSQYSDASHSPISVRWNWWWRQSFHQTWMMSLCSGKIEPRRCSEKFSRSYLEIPQRFWYHIWSGLKHLVFNQKRLEALGCLEQALLPLDSIWKFRIRPLFHGDLTPIYSLLRRAKW